MTHDEDYDHDAAELRAEARWERQQSARLAQHPHCADPDHPGCVHCREDQSTDDEDEDAHS